MRYTTRIIGVGILLAGVGGLTFAALGRNGAKPATTGTKIGVAATAKLPYTWRNVVVRGGGFVSGIITHPTKKGLMYARTDMGGAYRWDEPVKRWTCITDHFGAENWNYTGIESIAIDPTNPDRVYIAVGTYTNNWAGNGAMIRSNDRGKTWKLTPLPFKNGGNMDGRSAGERLAVNPVNPAHLLFGSRDNGMWESSDSGATWAKHATFPVKEKTNGVGIAFVVFDRAAKTVYAGVSDKTTGLYKSVDNGATWKPVANPAPLLPNHGVLDGVGNLYISCGDAPGPNGMTSGAVWKYDTKTGVYTDATPLKPGTGDNFGYGGVTVDAKNPRTVMAATMDRWAKHDTIFRTTDGGKTWNDLGVKSERDSSLSPYLNWGRPKADLGHWLGDIEIDPFNSDRVLYVTGATIWSSVDATAADKGSGTRWVVGANGVEETVPTNLISPPGNSAPLLSSMGDIDGFRHTSLDESPATGFHQPSRGTSTDIEYAGKNPNIVARVHGKGGQVSADNGVTWRDFAAVPDGAKQGRIAVSASGATIVWTPEDDKGTFVSSDNGTTWKAVTGLPATVKRVVADREDTNRFYAVSEGNVYDSMDSGATFTRKVTGLPASGDYLQTVPSKGGDVWFCAENGGLHHSTDGGATWAKIAGITEAHRVGFGKAAPGHDYPAVYVAGKVNGDAGFFRSDDAGATWARINDDSTGYHYINVITGDPRVYGRVYLGTGGRGIVVGELREK